MDKSTTMENLALALQEKDGFNGAWLYAENGEIVSKGALGFRDPENTLPITEDTIFQLASISKQFTATAVMLLMRQSLLSPEDRITKYFPELAAYEGVTVRHLLNHTSGIPDYFDDADWFIKIWKEEKRVPCNDEILSFLLETKAKPYFAPGEGLRYSNTGYNLLALLVERLSGVPFEEFLQKNIFEPAGMTSTRCCHIRRDGVPFENYARATVFEDDKWVADIDSAEDGEVVAFDGLNGDDYVYTNIFDMLRWDRALREGKVLTAEEQQIMYTPGRLNNCEDAVYDEDDGLGYGFVSQNGLSHVKAIGENDPKTGTSTYLYDKKDAMGTAWWTNQLDNLYYNTFILDGNSENPCWNAASDFLMNRANTGYIGEYDMNLSGNINNRVYLGLTVGIHDVHYKGLSEYTESLLKEGNVPAGQVTVSDERTITGTGVDIKAGIIFRPIESSPFRIGLSIATPTFYKLKSQSSTRLLNNTEYHGPNPNYVAKSSYEFKLYTPWKFGLSLGHTIDQFIALGAGLEYADYSSMDTREITDEYYDYYYDTTTTNSESDVEMNRHTSETLKGVLQLKLGAEVKIDKNFAVRFGYNYASPMYKEDGSKDFDIDSYGTNCASATDFTNWKATNRLTCGFGYRYNNFSVDLAYQYSVRKGTFYPFQSAWGDYYYDEDGKGAIAVEQIDITPTSVSVENKRHQVLLTLGYTF